MQKNWVSRPDVDLFYRGILDADGHGDRYAVAGRGEFAGFTIHAIGHHIIRILIGGQHEGPRRIEFETSWCFTLRGLMADGLEMSGLIVNHENSDAVVPAIGNIHELSVC